MISFWICYIHVIGICYLGKSTPNLNKFNKLAKDQYDTLSDGDKVKLKNQAEVNSNTTIYLSKKKIYKEGRNIIEKIGKEVSYIVFFIRIDYSIVLLPLSVAKTRGTWL